VSRSATLAVTGFSANDAFRRYLARAESLGFESAWAGEQVLGSAPHLDPMDVLTDAAGAPNACGWGARCSSGGCSRAMGSRPTTRRATYPDAKFALGQTTRITGRPLRSSKEISWTRTSTR